MTDAAREEAWDHTAWLTAHVVNAAGPKHPVSVKQVNPYRRGRRKTLRGKQGFQELRSIMF